MEKELCFRCSGNLAVTEEHEDITFYECKDCKRRYAKSLGKSLTDRWMNPISIALYAIIFDTEKVSHERIENMMKSYDNKTLEQKKQLIEEIEEEIRNPKQKLVDMLDLKGTEEIARDYLYRFAIELKKTTTRNKK